MDNDDSGPGAQWEAPDLHEKLQKTRHICVVFRWARRENGTWVLLLGYCGHGMNMDPFEKVSYGGRVLRNASAMTAEREPCERALST